MNMVYVYTSQEFLTNNHCPHHHNHQNCRRSRHRKRCNYNNNNRITQL